MKLFICICSSILSSTPSIPLAIVDVAVGSRVGSEFVSPYFGQPCSSFLPTAFKPRYGQSLLTFSDPCPHPHPPPISNGVSFTADLLDLELRCPWQANI